jgi:threonine/homoserine/homoserine lactone efflux protein
MNGLLTGLMLQLAIGPVFFFVLNIALQRTMVHGFLAVIAVTAADYCYILLALAGVGKLLEQQKTKRLVSLISAGVLCLFGMIMLLSARDVLILGTIPVETVSSYSSSFISAFLLTISSPLTIVFWTSLFVSKAVDHGYAAGSLAVFGISAGLSTLLFLGGAVLLLSLCKATIPGFLVKISNGVIGVVLITYGMLRFKQTASASQTGYNRD